ncbi:MAG: hypothetical protein R2712_18350 [Vicinamibacterales bacterium]
MSSTKVTIGTRDSHGSRLRTPTSSVSSSRTSASTLRVRRRVMAPSESSIDKGSPSASCQPSAARSCAMKRAVCCGTSTRMREVAAMNRGPWKVQTGTSAAASTP